MKNSPIPWNAQYPLLCAAVAALIGCSATPGLRAQTPALVAVATHAPALHRAAASMGAAEPQSASSPDPSTLKDDLFAGTTKFAKNATEATEVNMDPDSLRMVDGPDARRAHRTLLNVVRHYEYDKPGMYSLADVDEFRHKLDTGDWHCSVHTRDLKSGESTDICNRRRSDGLIENAIITVEPKELTFIHTIQRPNGQGGKVMDWHDAPGMSMVPGVSASVFTAAVAPQLRADLAASMAGMAASEATMKAELLASTAHLRGEMEHFEAPNMQLHTEHLQEEMDRLRSSLQDLPRLEDNQQLEHLRERLRSEHNLDSRE